MMTAVAVLEMIWPRTAVRMKRPASSARGPASPTRSTSPFASSAAAPVWSIATDKRQHRADEDHGRPVDRAVHLLDGEDAEQHDGAGREQPRHRRRHDAGREQDHHRPHDRDHRGCARAHRHGLPADELGESTTSTSACSAAKFERVPGALQQQGVARGEGRVVRDVVALALDGEHDQVAALGVTIPGKNRSPISGERGGITTSARPELRLNSVFSTRSRLIELLAEPQAELGGECAHGLGRPAHHDVVARLDLRAHRRGAVGGPHAPRG